jgi:transcriptional regulator with XRE-family HTH domain
MSVEKIRVEIAERLRNARAVAGVGQLPLSVSTGVHQQTVSRYECGHCWPSLEWLYLVADHYQISIHDLLPNNLSQER